MRIRTIKPEFWRSDDIARLSFEDRLLFIGLWSYVDDNGVGLDDHRQIAADLFALEDDQEGVREYIQEGLARLSRGLQITRYSINGKRYLYVSAWDKHQKIDKPSKPRYPRPSEPSASDDVPPTLALIEDSRGSREDLAPGTGEQGNRGTDKRSARPRAREDPEFIRFWETYPRRIAKGQAEKAWTKAAKETTTDVIINAAKRFADETRGKDPTYVAYPSTWLNGRRWEDEATTNGHRPADDRFSDLWGGR